MKRLDSDFISSGLRCAGWLYLPDNSSSPPVILMAHGFGAEKTFGLEPFAEYFVQRGMAVYLFDYRNFGGSEGQPRNLVSPSRHLQDWSAAIKHVKGISQVDSSRIALWGTSFSGGHVLVTAAMENDITAVVTQIPFVDGLSSASIYRPWQVLQALGHGLWDVICMVFQAKPHCVPLVSLYGEFAVLSTADAKDGYYRLVPPAAKWENKCPARIFFTLLFYRPLRHASKITCPVKVIMAEKDSLIPQAAVERMAVNLRMAEVLRMPIGHFEAYLGQPFATIVEHEAVFLKRYLNVSV